MLQNDFTNKSFQRATLFNNPIYRICCKKWLIKKKYTHNRKGGWKEIDTAEDYQNAITMVNNRDLVALAQR